MDLTKGHEGLVALYRPPAIGPSAGTAGEARRQPATSGAESLMSAALAPAYPYPNASRGRAALTAEGACLCGGSYQEEGQYTVSIANMAACRIEEPDKPVIDLVAQHYDPPTAASIIARYLFACVSCVSCVSCVCCVCRVVFRSSDDALQTKDHGAEGGRRGAEAKAGGAHQNVRARDLRGLAPTPTLCTRWHHRQPPPRRQPPTTTLLKEATPTSVLERQRLRPFIGAVAVVVVDYWR